MSLLPNERQALDDIIAERYEVDGPVVRDVAMSVTEELERLAGSGVEWVAAVAGDWQVIGALNEVKEWMRRQMVAGRTKANKPVEVPAFGGVKVDTDDGPQYLQLRLLDMTRDQLAAHVEPKRRQRDTQSRRIQFYDLILDDMDRCGHATVREAVGCLGLADEIRDEVAQ